MLERTFAQLHRRAKARGVALLAALVVLLVSGVGAAATAPMCNEHGQSIAAPFPLYPSHDGEARAYRPCRGQGTFEVGGAPAPEPDQPQSVAGDGFDRAPPAQRFVLLRTRGRALRAVDRGHGAPHPGFGQGVFRPPRRR